MYIHRYNVWSRQTAIQERKDAVRKFDFVDWDEHDVLVATWRIFQNRSEPQRVKEQNKSRWNTSCEGFCSTIHYTVMIRILEYLQLLCLESSFIVYLIDTLNLEGRHTYYMSIYK